MRHTRLRRLSAAGIICRQEEEEEEEEEEGSTDISTALSTAPSRLPVCGTGHAIHPSHPDGAPRMSGLALRGSGRVGADALAPRRRRRRRAGRCSCSGELATDRETDRETDRQTDRQTHRQTDRQTHRQTDRETDRQTDSRLTQGEWSRARCLAQLQIRLVTLLVSDPCLCSRQSSSFSPRLNPWIL